MARKKKLKLEEFPVTLALSQEELMQLRLYEAEAKLAKSEGRLRAMERAIFLSKVDPEGRLTALDGAAIELARQESRATGRYNEVFSRAGARLGIDLGLYSFDDETGVLHQVIEKAG